MTSSKAWLYFATPSYNGSHQNLLTILDLYRTAQGMQQLLGVRYIGITTSLLAYGFNEAWCQALNARDAGEPVYFLMLHADIEAKERGWLKTLFDEMAVVDADVLSAVVPIKDTRGLTSTARDTDFWRPRRYTLKEIHAHPEKTFAAPDLLLNTGMMLVNMRGDWVYNAHFTINDTIHKVDGAWRADVAPEDWNFSRMARKGGARLFATSAIDVLHKGMTNFDSSLTWGQDTDTANIRD